LRSLPEKSEGTASRSHCVPGFSERLVNSTQVYLKTFAERLKEIQLSKQTIKTNRTNEMNTIKQTPQNKNSSPMQVVIGPSVE